MLDGGEAIEGSVDFLDRVERAGANVLFLTNRTVTPKEEVLQELQRVGITCSESQLLTAAEAAGARVTGKRVFVIGEGGLLQEVASQAYSVTDKRPDVVVVGLSRGVTYRDLERAARFVHDGATFLATNLDSHYYSDGGISPGAGAIAAAIATASGTKPIVVGKPGKEIFTQALERLQTPVHKTVVIGDNLQTDVRGGRSCGMATILFQSRVSQRYGPEQNLIEPDWICSNFIDLDSTVFKWFDYSGSRPRR